MSDTDLAFRCGGPMRSKILKRLRSDGPVHLLETTFNRWVPAWLFRYSAGHLLAMDMGRLRSLHRSDRNHDPSLVFETADGVDRRHELRRATWNSVRLDTTTDDIGYAIRHADGPDYKGGVWIGRDHFLESNLGFRITLRPNQAWLYCAYIDQAIRGGGVYKRLLGHVAEDVADRGLTEMLVVIQPWNRASMHIHQKYAARTVGRIRVIRWLRFTWVRCDGELSADGQWTMNPGQRPITIQIPTDPATR